MHKVKGMTRCVDCSEYKRQPELNSQGYIGVCRRYNRNVIDWFCGCEENRTNGRVTLWNFTEVKKC